eukprot:jgi/Mesen1/10321/ME000079S09729
MVAGLPAAKRVKVEPGSGDTQVAASPWSQLKGPSHMRTPPKAGGEAVTAAAVAAAAAPGVGTGGLVAEVEPRPDFSLWTVDDDLTLLHAMEVGVQPWMLAAG